MHAERRQGSGLDGTWTKNQAHQGTLRNQAKVTSLKDGLTMSNQASQMLGERERERCCILLGTVAGCFVPIRQAWLCILDAAGFDAIGPELEFEDIRALG